MYSCTVYYLVGKYGINVLKYRNKLLYSDATETLTRDRTMANGKENVNAKIQVFSCGSLRRQF